MASIDDSYAEHTGNDGSTMSHQVDELLASLDRFTFSSGKAVPLSASKKYSVAGSVSPSPQCRNRNMEFRDQQQLDPRQEDLQQLWQEAQHERAAARRWAQQVQEAVWNWVRKQQDLVRIQQQQQQPADPSATYQHVIERLQTTIEQLEMELGDTVQHSRTVERQLHDIIARQQAQIDSLRQQQQQQLPSQQAAFALSGAKMSESSPSRTIGVRSMRTVSPPLDQHGVDHTFGVGCAGSQSLSPVNNSTMNSAFSHHTRRRRRKYLTETGSEITIYGNGSQKERLPDGTSIVRFPNGDVQTHGTDGSVAYLFADSSVIQIQQPDGTRHFQYPNGQLERHWTNGRKVVYFTDGTTKNIGPPLLEQQQHQQQTFPPELLSVVVEPSQDDPDSLDLDEW